MHKQNKAITMYKIEKKGYFKIWSPNCAAKFIRDGLKGVISIVYSLWKEWLWLLLPIHLTDKGGEACAQCFAQEKIIE